VLPSDKNEYVVVRCTMFLNRVLQPVSIVDVETDVDRQAKPYRGWLNCREWTNVVICVSAILFRMRRIWREDGVGFAKRFCDERR
jgi:hypothetical protein